MSDVLILDTDPPNIEKIRLAFPDLDPDVIFAYDHTIYNPSGDALARPLIAHEKVHFRQQDDHGDVDDWWECYCEDPEFRLRMELPAHQAEYRMVKQIVFNPEQRNKLRMQIVTRISSKLYGDQIITYMDALRQIK